MTRRVKVACAAVTPSGKNASTLSRLPSRSRAETGTGSSCPPARRLSGSTAVKPKPPVPRSLARVLLSGAQIRRRVRTLAAEIKAVYGEEEFTLISLINGAVMFTSDLMREIDNPVRLDCIRVSSYGARTTSIGTPQLISSLTLDIRRRHVLVIDDILDTGKTLQFVTKLIRRHRPASLRTCVLLDKKARRQVAIEADFVGFTIPDEFVVGYGLDFAERYRNLPCIGVLRKDLQQA